EYLRLYPKGEYADNAQYWIGETFYSEQDYERAALAFNDVLKKYPNGDKVSLAMLRLGFSFFEMKNYDLARTSLLKVVEKFPNTKQASVAKRKLLLIKAMTEQEKKTPAASGKPS
ncbi:MAG: tol-pal system protein YbgF, partial [Candidatus Methylomirabilis sp.]|nr:tol-pal system protein YbgF [Deltaproteobacteria bacterium]